MVRKFIARVVGKVALLRPYRKAVAGFVAPGVVGLGLALLPGSPGGTAVTSGEWQGALAAMLATAGVVWKVRNTQPPSKLTIAAKDPGAAAAIAKIGKPGSGA